MTGKELLKSMDFVDDNLIEEAEKQPLRCVPVRRWAVLLTAAVLCCLLALPAAAAWDPSYRLLYAVLPVMAQRFRPVKLSCEDKGIRMEVQSASIHGDTAEFYIALTGTGEVRLDETTDLFDSYQINSPYDGAGSCERVDFDEETGTAVFKVYLRNVHGEKIEGKKITFSLGTVLTQKQQLEGVELAQARQNPAETEVNPRGMSGGLTDEWEQNGEKLTAIQPSAALAVPTEGVSVTGVGFVGDVLHVQVYYEDICSTDNHGWMTLRNKETGEKRCADDSFSFFDEDQKGSYEEYLFRGLSAKEMEQYELYGEFTTAKEAITGNWSVTFPIQNEN